jgi:hypothetical protein
MISPMVTGSRLARKKSSQVNSSRPYIVPLLYWLFHLARRPAFFLWLFQANRTNFILRYLGHRIEFKVLGQHIGRRFSPMESQEYGPRGDLFADSEARMHLSTAAFDHHILVIFYAHGGRIFGIDFDIVSWICPG